MLIASVSLSVCLSCLKPKFDQLFCIFCLNLRCPRSGRAAEIFSSTHVLHPLIIRCLQAWQTDRQTNIKKAFWAVKLSSGFLLNSWRVHLMMIDSDFYAIISWMWKIIKWSIQKYIWWKEKVRISQKKNDFLNCNN